MPTYVYKCSSCGEEFLVSKKMSESSRPEVCAVCSHEKNARLDVKQNEMKKEMPISTLLPNVGGEVVDSWSEAKKLAESKGKVSETYDHMVKKEVEAKK